MTIEELIKALNGKEDCIIIEGDKANDVYRIIATGNVALSYMLFAFYNTHSETPFRDIKSMPDKAILDKLFIDFLDIASKRLLATVYNQAY